MGQSTWMAQFLNQDDVLNDGFHVSLIRARSILSLRKSRYTRVVGRMTSGKVLSKILYRQFESFAKHINPQVFDATDVLVYSLPENFDSNVGTILRRILAIAFVGACNPDLTLTASGLLADF